MYTGNMQHVTQSCSTLVCRHDVSASMTECIISNLYSSLIKDSFRESFASKHRPIVVEDLKEKMELGSLVANGKWYLTVATIHFVERCSIFFVICLTTQFQFADVLVQLENVDS